MKRPSSARPISKATQPCRDNLKTVAKLQFRQLTSHDQAATKRNLKSLGTLDVVSGCTGSNVGIVSAKHIVDTIGAGKLTEPFNCEIITRKAMFSQFISEQVLGEQPCSFSDLKDLSQESAHCRTHEKNATSHTTTLLLLSVGVAKTSRHFLTARSWICISR
jgi:hypothetical protein